MKPNFRIRFSGKEKQKHVKHFRPDPGKTEEGGKNIRGRVLETYFAGCPGFYADATQKGDAL